MRVAFVHQNFPGQFRHLVEALLARGDQVFAIGDAGALKRWGGRHPNLGSFGHQVSAAAAPARGELSRLGEQIQRGRAVADALKALVTKGMAPDLVVGHPGWGELMFVRAALPGVPMLGYCEFYYHDEHSDVDFDPEYPPGPNQREALQLRRIPLLLSLDDMAAGLAPTRWQRDQIPEPYRPRVEVVHEGVDTDSFAPDAAAQVTLGGRTLRRGEPVVTFTARNLEPYRGFHMLMRALPRLQALAPQAVVAIVGGDDVSYGIRLPPGQSYRARLVQELGGRVDWSRVVFSERVPYATHRALLQVSAAHVHMNYPFVLSWSAMEASACGCAIVASATLPVRELIEDGVNGLLVDFFDHEALATRVADVLQGRVDAAALGAAARRVAVERYDLKRVCLPAGLALLDRVAGMTRRGA